ncbi:MAG TPA: hypothetical protein VHM28_10830, partial [Anaerolineales bacterium]|nr:hypothetical protein [Anaerolineales bacterium]
MTKKEADIKVPKFTPEEQKGLQDYWKIYEARRGEITADLTQAARKQAEFKFILQNSTSTQSAEERAENLEIQRRAILDGKWNPYLKNLQTQGMLYARAGLSFPAWFEIVGLYRKLILP